MHRGGNRHRSDWICADCGNDVFGSKDKCGKCGLFRSKSDAKGAIKANCAIPAAARKPGDWDCACGELNFAARISCRRCAKAKPAVPAAQQPIPDNQPTYRAGDWFCAGCNELNFGARDACFKCGCNRAGHHERKDTSCAVCLMENKTVTIKTCGHFAMCATCAQKFNHCPMCRQGYNPLRDLLRTFDVAA